MWDHDFSKRIKIKAILDTYIPEFSVRMGGTTSIDVTKPGIDKAYGIRKLRDILGIAIDEMISSETPSSPAAMTIRPKNRRSLHLRA